MSGIYIHIPFCEKKCLYCDFVSGKFSSETKKKYLEALMREMEFYEDEWKEVCFESIYFGGGTPSLLSSEEIEIILLKLNKNFGIKEDSEITLEVNPSSVNLEKLCEFRKVGINRLSIGIVSFNDKILKFLGRTHSGFDCISIIKYARNAGFINISLDLLFGMINQSFDEWIEELGTAISFSPEHISIYSLTVEPETVFGKWERDGRILRADEEIERGMYCFAIEKLKEVGYEHYEISNFAKEGFRSKHNQIYWIGENYLGLGVGAHSHLKGKRWWNVKKVSEYISLVLKRGSAFESKELLSASDRKEESIFLSLRMKDGLDLQRFEREFGEVELEKLLKKINGLERGGFIFRDENKIGLTTRGVLVSDAIFSELTY